jgi:hypothetical protein
VIHEEKEGKEGRGDNVYRGKLILFERLSVVFVFVLFT